MARIMRSQRPVSTFNCFSAGLRGGSGPCGCYRKCRKRKRSKRDLTGDAEPDTGTPVLPEEHLPNAFDHVRDSVPMRGSRQQGLQNQHVKRALQHLGGLLVRFFLGHTGV